MTEEFVNASAYKFGVLTQDELKDIRKNLQEKGGEYGKEKLCGTVLLTAEGANIRLSGTKAAIAEIEQAICASHPNLAGIEYKHSFSSRITLGRWLVKVKTEVISMGDDSVKPAEAGLKEHISAEEFKQWMDQGKDMLILDTRNDYEVKLGTFENAMDLKIRNFRDFPEEAKKQLADIPKKKPVVMFCTGGVRCEKASYALSNNGFENVYQLDGGIIKYFEKVGGDHYKGDCFIFDDRVALTPELKEGTQKACFVCRAPVTLEEQQLESYVPEKSCLHCIDGKNDYRTIHRNQNKKQKVEES